MTWEMPAHTRAKHVILRNYLNAWFPIMAFTNPRIVYIDGFAGPGRYTGGEDGSPIMALNIANDIYNTHKAKLQNKEFVFLFTEASKSNYESLIEEIDDLTLPNNFKVMVEHGEFADVLSDGLDKLGKNSLAPTFAFIDPFGTKGVPFDLVKRIMSYKSCEVFFNHMYSGVVRSVHTTDHTELYGTDEWKEFVDLTGPDKHEAFTGLYANQLNTEAKVKYVRTFDIRNTRNATIFDLIYATNNEIGLDKMKTAMWKADPQGNFTFRDTTNKGQMVLFEDEPDLSPLRRELLENFAGKTVSIETIEQFVITETAYLTSHIRRKTLTPLEKEGIISVNRTGKSGFPSGTKISFPS
ncbi:three-Cys-motif partner protein TcmP [Brevibacillus sp. FSL L8-0520]|uniref:three-Cys-motif partner protein TcmP n=1 Tax=unclassified Brevibacillus TaxID=2684853 RepID=UPI000426EE45|nr:three-Cys-motif partner protein TcmP [Brevibacillus sp. NSP2.1]QHZ55777.1 three-Cys-motif partner protein TcmP [Brevibacillus sp. NSP2.1]